FSLIWQCLLFASLTYLICLEGVERQELRYRIKSFQSRFRTYRIGTKTALETDGLSFFPGLKTMSKPESFKIAFITQALPYRPPTSPVGCASCRGKLCRSSHSEGPAGPKSAFVTRC